MNLNIKSISWFQIGLILGQIPLFLFLYPLSYVIASTGAPFIVAFIITGFIMGGFYALIANYVGKKITDSQADTITKLRFACSWAANELTEPKDDKEKIFIALGPRYADVSLHETLDDCPDGTIVMEAVFWCNHPLVIDAHRTKELPDEENSDDRPRLTLLVGGLHAPAPFK